MLWVLFGCLLTEKWLPKCRIPGNHWYLGSGHLLSPPQIIYNLKSLDVEALVCWTLSSIFVLFVGDQFLKLPQLLTLLFG